MKKLKKILLILIIVTNINILTGCWNYKETNDMGIVAGVAIDKDKLNNKYILTTEIISFTAEGGGNTITSDIYITEGVTPFDSVRDILIQKSEKPYWTHTKIIIFSKDIAEEDIVSIVDYLYRDAEIRGDIKFLISKENTAGEILNIKTKKDKDIISFSINQAIEFQKSVAKYPVITMWEFITSLGTDGSSPIVTSIDKELINGKERFRVFGGYAFKGDKLVGWLNSNECKSALWVTNKIKGGIVQVEGVVNGNKYKNDLEIFKSKTKIKPIIKDNKVALNINVDIDVGIAAIDGDINFMQKDNMKILQKDGEQYVKKSMEHIINKAQNIFKSDIFGFSDIIQREMPKEWKKIKPYWCSIFQSLETNVDVKININNAALNSEIIKVGESK